VPDSCWRGRRRSPLLNEPAPAMSLDALKNAIDFLKHKWRDKAAG
jgi:hypothetical protein